MNTEKLNEIGEKLNIDVSSIKQNNSKGFITKPIYFLIQYIIYGISLISGVIVAEIIPHVGYPYGGFEIPIVLNLTPYAIHAGNGIITLPGQYKYGLSRNIRITVFLVNFMASLLAFYLLLETQEIYHTTAGYGVFDQKSSSNQRRHYEMI